VGDDKLRISADGPGSDFTCVYGFLLIRRGFLIEESTASVLTRHFGLE
jgi:hypothetical protein